MAKQRPLKNAPVGEAVIDIRVRFTEAVEIEALGKLGELIRAGYPTEEKRFAIQMQYNVEKKISDGAATLVGYLFRSADKLQVAQSKSDGFSFSRLKPYEDWESTMQEAWRIWQIYRDTFKPERVVRVATRFINRLELPGPTLDFDEYLSIGPRLPDGLPQNLAAFSTFMNIPNVGPATVAIVRTSFEPIPGDASKIPVILDVDIVRECDIDPRDDSTLQRTIAELRPIKNAAFFGSVTEKAVEVFA